MVQYIGRFAPTPSGPLHFGSIIAALASYLDAKKNQGKWLVRIDDIDPPRIRAGASGDILSCLEKLGLYWDEEIVYQSRRTDVYRQVIGDLQSKDLLYPCYCPRQKVKGSPYPGTCRDLDVKRQQRHALRIIVTDEIIALRDGLQDRVTWDLKKEVGDFIVRRSDGIIAYHLATVIDDAWQKITHIVRGADLLPATANQLYLQQCLGLDPPVYLHFPIAIDQKGKKISKQDHAENVLLKQPPLEILIRALAFLGQEPGEEIRNSSVDEVVQWGINNWQPEKIPCQQHIRISL